MESTRTLEPKICRQTGSRTALSWGPRERVQQGGVTHFDLVRVHAGVGDQDLDVLHPLGLVHADLLVQQETCKRTPRLQTADAADDISALTFIQVGVRQAAAQLLDDVDGVQVPGALQPDDGVHRQLGEVLLVMSQQFGGQRGPGDVQEVLLETGGLVAMETAGEERGSRSEEKEQTREAAAAVGRTCGRPPPPSGRRAPPAWPSSSPR